ncbi:MAG: hypothetical protein FVQ83_14890 [Chloroflexi bacterium]|nr:hypothetical protein [Chloroflexota bacterium]
MTNVKVGVGQRNPSHDLSLSDGVQTWGLRLDGGPRAIQEIPETPSTLRFSGGGTKFGDWTPGYSHIEQRTAVGGRGLDDFSLDATRFFDSHNLFSMLDGKIIPALQWKFASGLRTALKDLPGDMDWQALTGNERYAATLFTVGGSNMGADNVEVWLRRIGSPGALKIEIWANDGANPLVLITSASASVTVSEITDFISQFYTVDLSAAADLIASTEYWVVVYGASTDNAANHWELGVNAGGSGSKDSSDGSTWAGATFTMYYRISDADIDRIWHFFEFGGALYAISGSTPHRLHTSTASTLLMNGERGVATAGGNTTLTDSNKGMDGSWDDDQWNGWYIKIVAGTGKGQHRLISDTISAGVITVSTAWGLNPSTDSEYVIYGGDAWQDISPGSGDQIDSVVTSVAVIDSIAYFAQGPGTNILSMQFDETGTPTHDFADDGTNKADILYTHYDPVDGPQMWRAENDSVDVSRATAVTHGNTLAYGTEIEVGDSSFLITNMLSFDGQLLIFKVDGEYALSNHRVTKMNIGLDLIKSENNGQAVLVHNTELVFSWGGFALQRQAGRDLASIGPDNGTGLPSGRGGKIAALASHPAGLFACVDGGGSNTSSLLFYNNSRFGWHEIFRAWGSGKRVQNIFWQDNPGTRPRLWISVNGDIVYQEWPKKTLNPLEDSGINFQHEAVLVCADIDMGAARLPKFIKEVTLISQKLTTGIEVALEYQLDEDIGTAAWTQAETFYSSPEDTLSINRGNVRSIRYRLRLLTNDADAPPIVQASILEGFARTPLKYQWNMRVKVGDNQLTLAGTKDHDPDAFMTWLKDAARQAKRIHMRANWEQMDDKLVIVEPPTLLRSFSNKLLGWWGGSSVLTLREA